MACQRRASQPRHRSCRSMIALLLGLLSSASLAAASRALAECCDDCPCTATRYLGTSKHILPDAPCPEGSVATVEALRAAATEGKFEVLTWSKSTEASRPRRRRGGRRRACARAARPRRALTFLVVASLQTREGPPGPTRSSLRTSTWRVPPTRKSSASRPATCPSWGIRPPSR